MLTYSNPMLPLSAFSVASTTVQLSAPMQAMFLASKAFLASGMSSADHDALFKAKNLFLAAQDRLDD